ncbi:MAG: hypothetical protein HYR73_03940 [Candidatus Eisenbacteria bacterium]|nr:hypothetical protein [Candidatus Eisenbacteria bacterium]
MNTPGHAETRGAATHGAAADIAAADVAEATDDATARRVARFLIREEPRPEEIARWRDAVRAHGAALTRERDRRLWSLLRSAPWLTSMVDAGLALSDPHSPVRHRHYLMLVVLEASPHHTRRFLPCDTSRFALIALGGRMVLAVLSATLGVVLVRATAWIWR